MLATKQCVRASAEEELKAQFKATKDETYSESVTGTARVGRGTSGINRLAESLGRFVGACHIRSTGIIRHITDFLDELVG